MHLHDVEGKSFSQIARAIGKTRQRAWQLYHKETSSGLHARGSAASRDVVPVSRSEEAAVKRVSPRKASRPPSTKRENTATA